MKFLLFAGSLRIQSLNKKLINSIHMHLKNQIIEHELIDLVDFTAPVYNGDIETTAGIPESIKKLTHYIQQTDALIIATPEYNGGISSPLKNTVDWLSRCKPMPLAGKHLLLASASPGQFGGVRGAWHTRVPFEILGVHVFPDMFSLPLADTQFDTTNKLIDEKIDERLKKLVTRFVEYVKKK
ncbi:MAG TPA: NADPH-dependent FMN reductase, partial [Patescibacteria group bacterium]|nr:NADPH-dependent FMN reductase [Patescibacteria group bacterium]